MDSSAGTFTAGQAGATNPSDAALGRPDAQRLTVVSTLTPQSAPAQGLVVAVRAVPGPDGTAPLVGGPDARVVDTKHSIGTHLPLAALIVVGTSLVVLFLFTGSVLQPVRALVLNALSLARHDRRADLDLPGRPPGRRSSVSRRDRWTRR